MVGRATGSTEGFEALAHPTRMEVVRALFEANRESDEGVEMSFSELQNQVEHKDSGNFSYHLNRLVGLYLARTDSGYRLTSRGFDVGLAIISDTYDEGTDIDPIENFGECLFCESSLEARFETSEGASELACGNGHRLYLTRMPTEAVENRSIDGLRTLVATELFAVFNRRVRGVCAACRCPINGSVEYDESSEAYVFESPCDSCGVRDTLPVGFCVLQDAEVVRFLSGRGADPWTTPPWEFDFCHLGRETVRATDPLRIEVEVAWERDTCVVVVDGTGSVREITTPR